MFFNCYCEIDFGILVKGKKVTSSSKTVTKTTRRKAEKKVYALPGQKYDIPEEVFN